MKHQNNRKIIMNEKKKKTHVHAPYFVVLCQGKTILIK